MIQEKNLIASSDGPERNYLNQGLIFKNLNDLERKSLYFIIISSEPQLGFLGKKNKDLN